MSDGHRKRIVITGLLVGTLLSFAAEAGQAPWLAVGDRGLRSDVELLAAYGLIGNLTTTWPIPAGQILQGLSNQKKLDQEPLAVQLAAQRVLATLAGPDPENSVHSVAQLETTNAPAVIRDFGSQARDEADAFAGLNYDAGAFNASLRVGEQTHYNGSGARFSLDGSYVAARWGNLQFYGGWLDQWYGPGTTTSLLLSNNARPFPKIGVMRANPLPFQTPWLSWLGPWQFNFFIGDLTGPRRDTNTGFVSLRFTFEPVEGLEIGLTRETEICGKNHLCSPFKDYFAFNNSHNNTNKINEEAGIDIKYTRRIAGLVVSPYLQFMNEDTGPFVHSSTSYLAGTTVEAPWGVDGAHWQLSAEYADSVATLNLFDFGKKQYGSAYNNFDYVDGFRYRGRTLGFSLDSDSRLFSLDGLFIDSDGRSWRLAYRHADISTPQLAAQQAAGSAAVNVVSARPVTLNEVEAGLALPWGPVKLEFTVRGQDRVPYLSNSAHVSGEVGVRYGF